MSQPPIDIPFNRASVEGRELEHVRASVESGRTASGGPFAARAAGIIQAETGAAEVLLTTSCTTALELSAMLLDLEPGDTVVVPSFTFTASALAFARQGARILFCDIERETLGIDPQHLAELLAGPGGDRVRAVVLVHYAGIACDVAGVRRALADRPDVAVVEDAAHGLYGRWQGRPLGSLGRLGALSFHETKNFVCGEGGALLINDAGDVDRARVLYDKGTDRQAFLLGEIDKYSWRDTGSSFGLSDTLAAYLTGQLEQAAVIQAKRRRVFEAYHAGLAPHAERLGLRLPVVPPDREPAWHLYHLLLPDQRIRTAVMAALRAEGIATTFHYVPLHSSEGGRRFAAREVDCPVTTDVSSRLLRLPFHNNLTEEQTSRVVSSLVRATEAALAEVPR